MKSHLYYNLLGVYNILTVNSVHWTLKMDCSKLSACIPFPPSLPSSNRNLFFVVISTEGLGLAGTTYLPTYLPTYLGTLKDLCRKAVSSYGV